MNFNRYKNLIKNITNLFLDESRKNATFVFTNSDEKITAHKIILEAASPVFKTMFSGSLPETNEVEIDDISPEVFRLFLSGIYLNNIHFKVNSDEPVLIYADLYYAAEKYDVEDIRELARDYMLSTCNEENAPLLFAKAKLFNLLALEAECKFFFKNYTYVVFTNVVLNNDHNLDGCFFHDLFDLEELAVDTEFDLYMGLQAIVENKQLQDYSKCLDKIRFLTIKTIEILSCKLLSSDDKMAIIANKKAQKLQNSPMPVPMPAHLSVENKPRKFIEVEECEKPHFWTAIMLKSDNYEDYFEDFCTQTKIAADSEETERIKTLIIDGKKKLDEEGREKSLKFSISVMVAKRIVDKNFVE